MNAAQILNQVLSQLTLNPTQDQYSFLEKFSRFLAGDVRASIFILRGYAGTGKTTMISVLIRVLPILKKHFVLLAPTGRAAKVLSLYSGNRSMTIHRKIYQTVDNGGGSIGFKLAKNKSKNTLFFVDEASMISGKSQMNNSLYDNTKLLDDLIDYVQSGENCQLVFIGDIAQLPPVNEKVSPALSSKLLLRQFGIESEMVEIREVLRQAKDSGILFNATKLRNQLFDNEFLPQIELNDFGDVFSITGSELPESIDDSYSKSGIEQTLILVKSNKSANKINQEIRHRILYREERIEAEDMLMVVKNNYFWIDSTSKPGFIANGDGLEVLSVKGVENKYGFEFADCEIRLVDYPNEPPIYVKVILNSILADTPSLPQSDLSKLYNELLLQYSHLNSKRAIHLKIKQDPYFNALQVKYAYAVTCHKAQGGQWKEVYIDQGYLNPDHLGVEYIRWLYTAVTRATKKLYFVNFNPTFFQKR